MTESQVKTLIGHLYSGSEIDRVNAFKWYGIADLRSRISDVERQLGVRVDRCKVEGKRYLKYFMKPNKV